MGVRHQSGESVMVKWYALTFCAPDTLVPQ